MKLHIPELVFKAMKQAEDLAEHSWEYGTLAEALVELLSPQLSVFNTDSFPSHRVPIVDAKHHPGLMYAVKHIKLGEPNLTGEEGKY